MSNLKTKFIFNVNKLETFVKINALLQRHGMSLEREERA